MPSDRTTITIRDESDAPPIRVEMTIWHDGYGTGICALEPKDSKSSAWLVANRDDLRHVIQTKYDLDKVDIYEAQTKGLLTPQSDKGLLMHGASLPKETLRSQGEALVREGKERQANDLERNNLPTPTTHIDIDR